MFADRFRTFATITLADATSRDPWVQLAVTGHFHSPIYGQFSITPDDLSTILRNYETEHPKAPTELMLDYEHRSVNPQTPEDGHAAGWFKELQLRGDGKELWARVELTEDAASAVRAKKYRYISPEIHRRFKSRTSNRELGYTLLAAALTNRPFLTGMAPIELSDAAGHSETALRLADSSILPYDERERRVREALSAAFPPAYKDGGLDFDTWVQPIMVYEDRCVFRKGSRMYRIAYSFGEDLSVTFTGSPVEVVLTDEEVVTLHEADEAIMIMECTQ